MYEWTSQTEKNKAMLESAPSSSDEGVLKYKLSESTEKKPCLISKKKTTTKKQPNIYKEVWTGPVLSTL